MDNLFISKVKETIAKYSMVMDGEKILCGYSGGADSTALLFALSEIYPKENIIACHVNHMIRGEEADSDENHCRDVCDRLGINFISEKIDIPSLVKEYGGSTEEVARDARYSLFEKLCLEYGISKIAVAHNKKDNAETVIFNLARGTSLRGLGGIPPVRGNIIRPLINIGRDEIETFLFDIGESYVTDSTNSDSAYSRNLIRNEILPLLSKISPSVIDNIARTAENNRRDESVFENLSQNDKLCEEFDGILSRRIQYEYSKLSRSSLSSQNINDCVRLIKKNELWSSLDLPDRVSLVITRNGYVFKKQEDCESVSFDIPLNIGINKTPLGDVTFTKNSLCGDNISSGSTYKKFSSDKLNGKIGVRSRLPGDKIKTNGINKSLKKLFNDKKIPLDVREKLFIFYDDDGIFWIPSVASRDDIKSDNLDITITIEGLTNDKQGH